MTGHRFVIALAIFLAAPRAFAQDPHAVAELTAKEAFALGDAAYDRHDWTTAITQYRRSMALLPSPNSRLLVARCLSHLGRNAEALTEYEITVDEASQRAERDPRYATTRDVARDEAGPLRAKVGFVRIAARNLPPASVVRIDGKTIPPEAYDLEVPHDPGPIDVAITGPHVASRHDALTIGAGAKLDVPPSPLAVYTPPVAAAPPPPSARHPLRALGIGGLVVGGAGLVGAVVLGAVTDHTYRSDRDRCRSERCTDADVQSGRTLATATYVSLGVGIAFAAAGASLLLLDKKSAATSAWTGSWRF